MDYSKFYTPPHIASLLINEIHGQSPDTVIDICCGSCNLLHAARKRWPNTKLFGVDIVERNFSDVCFSHMDGRAFAIEHPGEYALVLANPPFDYVEKKREYSEIFSGSFSNLSTKRLEIEMLLANLLLLQENGILLIIMPSTFVEATSYKTVRELIGRSFYLRSIIKLPDDTFGSKHIKSYALIIEHRKTGNHVTKLYSLMASSYKEYEFSSKTSIPQKKIRTGEWLQYIKPSVNIDLDLRRGNISSQAFVTSGTPILHTAKQSQKWMPSVRYVEGLRESAVCVEHGDIIISRVGKSAGQWCQHKGGRIAISDCLYCLKDPDGSIINRIRGKEYNLSPKGVATPYITMEDFSVWYCSIVDT